MDDVFCDLCESIFCVKNLVSKFQRMMSCLGERQREDLQNYFFHQSLCLEEFLFFSFDLFLGHVGDVLCVSWAQNSESFVSSSMDKTVRLWKVRIPEQKTRFFQCFNLFIYLFIFCQRSLLK